MTPIAQRAVDEWNREVDAEMARLIERGVPPWKAATKAQETVQQRREQRADSRDDEAFRMARAAAGY